MDTDGESIDDWQINGSVGGDTGGWVENKYVNEC